MDHNVGWAFGLPHIVFDAFVISISVFSMEMSTIWV
jgi:hypothetical protein